jgi:hypothetical protein
MAVQFILRKTQAKKRHHIPECLGPLKEVAQVVDGPGIYIRPLLWSLQVFCLSNALQQSWALNDHLPLLKSVEEVLMATYINTSVYFCMHYVNSF